MGLPWNESPVGNFWPENRNPYGGMTPQLPVRVVYRFDSVAEMTILPWQPWQLDSSYNIGVVLLNGCDFSWTVNAISGLPQVV